MGDLNNMTGIVETFITYTLPRGIMVLDKEVRAVSIMHSRCIDGCCNETLARLVDENREVLFEYDMEDQSEENTTKVESVLTDEIRLAIHLIHGSARRKLDDGIHAVLDDIQIGQGNAPEESVGTPEGLIAMLAQALGIDTDVISVINMSDLDVDGEVVDDASELEDEPTDDGPYADERVYGHETVSSEY